MNFSMEHISFHTSPLSRRSAIRLLGLGITAAQFPFACASKPAAPPDTGEKLYFLTINELADRIKSKQISSEEITKMILERIAKLDQKLNSYLHVMTESALATARAMDKELIAGNYRGPLHGIPIGVKDLLYTTNAPSTMGHSFNKNFIATYNATVVEKLQHAGAVIVGKLNQTEGAMDGYSKDFLIPRNPWGEDLWTGVSSSGSGVATAAGMCFGSIGSDTGGSIRFPSAANGIVGLKPTYGLVSKYGAMPLSDSFDHLGPMTRSTLDAAIMLDVISGYDKNDPHSLKTEQPLNLVASIKDGIKGLRIGVDPDYISNDVDPALTEAIEKAIEKMEELGATITSFKMPGDVQMMSDAWFVITAREALIANKETYPSKLAEYGRSFADFLEIGANVSDEQFEGAVGYCKGYKDDLLSRLSEVDAVVAPAGGMAGGVTDELWRDGFGDNYISRYGDVLDLHFGGPANIAGIPSLTIPCGKAEDDFPPPGLQLMGAPLTEDKLCRIGYAYELATEWHKQHPPV